MKLWSVVAVIVLSSAAYLTMQFRAPGALSVDRPNQPPIQLVPEDDAVIEAATARARATIDTLLAALARTQSPPKQAQLKVRIEDEGVVEHVWLVDLRYQGGMIYGALGNEPLQLENWRLGDAAMVDPSEITDWLLIDENGLQGGYTLRASRERMTPQERERFDADFATHFGVAPERLDDVR